MEAVYVFPHATVMVLWDGNGLFVTDEHLICQTDPFSQHPLSLKLIYIYRWSIHSWSFWFKLHCLLDQLLIGY